MCARVPSTGRIFIKSGIVDLHEYLLRRFNFRLTWTKVRLVIYAGKIRQSDIVVIIYIFSTNLSTGDIQIIKDVA